MRTFPVLLTVLTAGALTAGGATAAPARPARVAFTDPAGDANFSATHGGAVPAGSQPQFDLVTVSLETLRRGRTPTNLKMTLELSGDASTAPTSSYGVIAQHSICGQMRIQVYADQDGPTGYFDLGDCGAGDTANTNSDLFSLRFTPRVEGKKVIAELPLKALPKQVKAGTTVTAIRAYTSNAEFLLAGYQPTDFRDDAGIDLASTDLKLTIG